MRSIQQSSNLPRRCDQFRLPRREYCSANFRPYCMLLDGTFEEGRIAQPGQKTLDRQNGPHFVKEKWV